MTIIRSRNGTGRIAAFRAVNAGGTRREVFGVTGFAIF